MLAEVLVNLPVKSIYRTFTYRIPPTLSHLDVGWRVLVPFGGRKAEGFILALSEMSEIPVEKVKDILSAVDDEAWFTPEMIAVAHWLADFYLCAPAEMMRLFMPIVLELLMMNMNLYFLSNFLTLTIMENG